MGHGQKRDLTDEMRGPPNAAEALQQAIPLYPRGRGGGLEAGTTAQTNRRSHPGTPEMVLGGKQ